MSVVDEPNDLKRPEADDKPREGSITFRCMEPDCGRGFPTQQGLNLHRNRVHGIKGKPRRRGDQAPKGKPKVEKPNGPGKTTRFSVEAQIEHEQGILGMIEAVEYEAAVKQFLPHLANELERRRLSVGPDDGLTAAFLTLFLDVS